jgi:multidrug efflux pump subunit AcrA (membrane-fusion protein)
LKYRIIIFRIIIFLSAIAVWSCRPHPPADEGNTSNPVTPVKVVNPETGSMSDYIELNATSSFLIKESIKSTANGYITDARVVPGQVVHKGQLLFTIQTKEARALGNIKNTYDTSLHFSGIISVLANKDGVISAITHQKGDYVQDADPLATVSEQSSLVFLIDAPFEYHKYLAKNKSCSILLPDGNEIGGIIQNELPIMDINSQTQNFIVKPLNSKSIPEGLIARIRILKNEKPQAQILPKSAVLSDEKEENFWVMKLLNDSTAVKIPVKPGLQHENKQEILSPVFQPNDRIISEGNYGLNDTAKVKITP